MQVAKIKGKLQLNPNEMAFRKVYKELLEQEKVTVIFRPGKRVCGDYRGYCPEQKVTVKVIDKVGADWAMLPPRFMRGFSKNIVITNVEVKKLKDFKKLDFKGATSEIRDRESLEYNLGIIYNIPPEEFTDDFLVTKTTFKYL